MKENIIQSTGDWESDKALLKKVYGTGHIPARTIANMVNKPVTYIYWLAKHNRLGSCVGHSYNFLLPQLINYVENTSILRIA